MRKLSFITLCVAFAAMLLLSGCFGKVNRTVTNYYVLDYQNTGEDIKLRRAANTGKILEVLNTNLPKTYDRNQIVVKENFYKVKFLQTDVWANKLRDAIPNLIVQRLRAYNIFGSVTRGENTEVDPHFFLDTTVLNIEKIEGDEPKAYLRIEFVLRDSTGSRVVLTHKNERYAGLGDPSMVYLVQAFNDMIMEETNIFAAKCNMFFSGKLQQERTATPTLSHIENYYYEKMEQSALQETWGELLVYTKTATEDPIKYIIEELDSLNTVIDRKEWDVNKPVQLNPGQYRVTIGENEARAIPVEIKPRQRSVVKPNWGELRVVILDESQTRVRLGYDLWRKEADDLGYKIFSGGMFSVGDDEIGSYDKLWIIPPGSYLVKLGGGSWSDLRNFATVSFAEGDRKTLTIIADPEGGTDLLVGAGVFSDDDLGYGSKRWHKGAVHANISLASNNNVDQNEPTNSLSLAAQFDNSIDSHDQIRPFHFTTRSIYDLGLNISTGNDFNFNLDDYSLKNVLLYYPLEKKPFFRNFAFYGRANVSTHFFDETSFFDQNKNYILYDKDGNMQVHKLDQSQLKTKIAFYPMRLKEGTGITYRVNFSPNSWISLRGGYGWQQDFNHRSYVLDSTQDVTIDGETHTYDIYEEEGDIQSTGLESTVIFSALNLFKFFSVNSTLDVLFPMGESDNSYRLENENRFNLRIYRNISMDIKLNIQYDKQQKPWVVYDYSSFLRLSLYY